MSDVEGNGVVKGLLVAELERVHAGGKELFGFRGAGGDLE